MALSVECLLSMHEALSSVVSLFCHRLFKVFTGSTEQFCREEARTISSMCFPPLNLCMKNVGFWNSNYSAQHLVLEITFKSSKYKI
jgi:hypothetical protein